MLKNVQCIGGGYLAVAVNIAHNTGFLFKFAGNDYHGIGAGDKVSLFVLLNFNRLALYGFGRNCTFLKGIAFGGRGGDVGLCAGLVVIGRKFKAAVFG